MKKYLLLYMLVFFSLCISFAEGRGVYINEICQSNVYHVDENMFLPDSWIELYNDSDEDVDLKGWRIVEGKKSLNEYVLNDFQYIPVGNQAWREPQSSIISAKSYRLIYCDEGGWGLHTSFKLDAEKKHNIWLYNLDSVLVDSFVNIPAVLYPDVSYGRVEGNDTLFSHFAFSTPNAPNHGEGVSIAPEVEFSQLGGIMTNDISVELGVRIDSLNDYIFYTVNGSEPTSSSLKYENPITIDSTTILRARVLKEGLLPRNTQTQSYLFPDHDIDLPIMSLVTDSRWFYDDTLGIYNGKATGVVTCEDSIGNYVGNRYRYVSIEYFESSNSDAVVNQQVLTRISGGCSRVFPHKSMIVKTNKRMPKSNFDYPLWKEKPNVTSFKSFMLRNSGQDRHRTMFRDAAVQHLLGGKVDLDIQAYQPCVLYVNGDYYGIYNIRERTDEEWVKNNVGFDDSDIDLIENFYDPKLAKDNAIVDLVNGIRDSVFTYQDVVAQIDTVELVNHIILEMFSGNHDWPQNNFVVWRPKEGGKWRFLCKDIDYAVGIDDNWPAYYTPLLEFLFQTPNMNDRYKRMSASIWDEERTRLVRYLLKDVPFKDYFIKKSILYLGTYLQKDSVAAVIDSFSYRIENEMFYHRDRWEGDDWYHSVDFLRQELINRVDVSYQHLTDYYGLGEPIPTIIKGEEESDIKLFNMQIPSNYFDGKLFTGMPASLKCSPNYYWIVSYKGLDGEQYTFSLPDSVDFEVSPAYLDLTLTTASEETNMQEVINVPECQWWVCNGVLHLNAIGEPLVFAEVLSADGKCLWSGENIEQLELPLPMHQVSLLRYQSSSKFGTFKIVN